MVPADAQADLAVGLEAPVGRGEAEAGRAQRVGRREDDAPVVDAAVVGAAGGSLEGEVPLEEVRLEGLGRVVCGWGAGDLGCFSDWQSLLSVYC